MITPMYMLSVNAPQSSSDVDDVLGDMYAKTIIEC